MLHLCSTCWNTTMPSSVAGKKKKMGYWYPFLWFWETEVTFLAPLSQEPIAYLEGGKVLNVTTMRLWVLFMLPAKSKKAKNRKPYSNNHHQSFEFWFSSTLLLQSVSYFISGLRCYRLKIQFHQFFPFGQLYCLLNFKN